MSAGASVDPRLRHSRIEAKAKPVYRVSGFSDEADVGSVPELEAELFQIIECIERGDGVPEQFYRSGIDDDPDRLLKEDGIIHLHLGGKDSDALLYLVQYDDEVWLLKTGTHADLARSPRSSSLAEIYRAALRGPDSAAIAKRVKEAEEAKKRSDEALRERKVALSKALVKLRTTMRIRGKDTP